MRVGVAPSLQNKQSITSRIVTKLVVQLQLLVVNLIFHTHQAEKRWNNAVATF